MPAALPEHDVDRIAVAQAVARVRARARVGLWLGPGSLLAGGVVVGLTQVAFGDRRVAAGLGALTLFAGHAGSLVELFACARQRTSDRVAGWLAAYWLLFIPVFLVLAALFGGG